MRKLLISQYLFLLLFCAGLNTALAENWFESGKTRAASIIKQKGLDKKAKNIVLFIGDGMGISTVNAARILEGQLVGQNGEENYLSFETFPYSGHVKTFCVDAQVADSACSATALATGVKNRIGIISYDQEVFRYQKDNLKKSELDSLIDYAKKSSFAAGIVTTTHIAHATPAAFYAHASDRNQSASITEQLLDSSMDVILGGGKLLIEDKKDFYDRSIAGWLEDNKGSVYVQDLDAFNQIEIDRTTKLIGLFGNANMRYEARRKHFKDEPSLSEMSMMAIKVLQKNKNGFFLMIEAGRIDHAHHNNSAYNALHDTIALSNAVRDVEKQLRGTNSLILVTADHDHPFGFSGYASRGNPILGKADGKQPRDGKPFTTLSYLNGPGYMFNKENDHSRRSLEDVSTDDPNYRQNSLIPFSQSTHAGNDVPIYAAGNGAKYFTGVLDQHEIFHLIIQASKLKY